MKFPYVYGENVEKNYPAVRITIERITPEIAKEMLHSNVSNRPKYKSAIGRALENGEWMMNGESIVFSDDGVLLDGQNRLFACIQSDVPIETIVVRGVTNETQITMDQGKKRTVTDYLVLHKVPNAKLLAPIGSFVLRCDLYGIEDAVTNKQTKGATTKEVVTFILQNRENRLDRLVPICTHIRSNKNNVCLTNGTIAIFFDALYNKGVNEDDISEFAEQLSGNRSACEPVRLLCNRYSNEVDSGGHATKQKLFLALMIKVWNAFVQGNEMQQLRFAAGGAHPEKFPNIVVGG